MTINADLHTHTVMSHGKGTPEQVVLAAIQKGLKKVAITDHAPSHMFFGIRNVKQYLKTINSLKMRYADKIEVLAGMELNIVSLDGCLSAAPGLLDRLDIVLLGYHKAVWYRNLKSAAHFYLMRKIRMEVNTKSYIEAIRKNKIDILVHPGYGIPLDHKAIADVCAKEGVAVEINASHQELSLKDLKDYADTGVKFAVSSDAHRVENVGRFDPAIQWAKKAGIHENRIINAEKS